jgi:hypothetical protein
VWGDGTRRITVEEKVVVCAVAAWTKQISSDRPVSLWPSFECCSVGRSPGITAVAALDLEAPIEACGVPTV